MSRKTKAKLIDALLDRVVLASYAPATRFNGREWYTQLAKRQCFLSAGERPKNYRGEPAWVTKLLDSPLDENGFAFIEKMPNKPVSDMSLVAVWREKRKAAEVEPHLADYLDQQSLSKDFGQLPDSSFPIAVHRASSSLMKPNLAYMLAGLGIGSRMEFKPAVTIDLRATDAQLRNYFDDWLAEKRAEQDRLGIARPRKKPFGPSDFKRWYKLRILPYMDMKIALRGMGLTATQRELGDRLFYAENIDSTEKVRKTLEPEIRKILLNSTPLNFGIHGPI